MTALHTDVTVPPGTWTRLTTGVDNLTTACRVQNIGTEVMLLQGTATFGTAPTTGAGAIRLYPGDIMPGDVTLAQLFGGVTSCAHVWGMSAATIPGIASVSHA
jgi:hypothetical protein